MTIPYFDYDHDFRVLDPCRGPLYVSLGVTLNSWLLSRKHEKQSETQPPNVPRCRPIQ